MVHLHTYDEFLDAVEELGYLDDREHVDMAVKMVLGILASRMPEEQARKFTRTLPEPFTFERLYGHQKVTLGIPVEEYVCEVADKFGLESEEARDLIDTVLSIARDSLDPRTLADLENHLPYKWAKTIEEA